jgi:hypothetical protein
LQGTITIVREKCKTLILKLRRPEYRFYGFGPAIEPKEDINQIISSIGDDLTHSIVEGINSIRDEVKKARPCEDDPNYKSKIDIYKNLIEYATHMINSLRNVFDESLTAYRLRIEQLWNDLQKTYDLEQINLFIEQFQKDSEKLFTDAVQKYLVPYLTAIDSKLNCLKECIDH